ncbi:MAG: Do family serine endopeptidase [Alphaproteobacteria bacterium]|nr:Do family serine endopeptidase [Alphaproteobacteria bacterium]
MAYLRTRAGALCCIMLAIGALAVPLATRDADAQKREVPLSREAVRHSFAPIVKTAAPAVVNVYVRKRVRAFRSPFANDPFFRRFFGDQFGKPSERFQNSLGSGVIVSPEGIVVTNTHVVKSSGETEIRVALSDQREFDAQIVSQDEKTDIAILKIKSNGEVFPSLRLGNSDDLEVGDLVLAIGNPFGVGQTVTSGIISALARSEVGRSDQQIFIQTDAAINPGNSGGALVDLSGDLVGINTLIFSKTGGSHGIGFAIPTNLVRLYVESALTGKTVERPWLGAKLETVTRDVAEALGLQRISGAYVVRLYEDGPAAAAGFELGDVITRVGGFEVRDERSVLYRLTTIGVGRRAKIEVLRSGKPVVVTLPLRKAPGPSTSDIEELRGDHPLDGLTVANIVGGLTEELDLEDERGVVVLEVQPNSVASRYRFRKGDVIFEVGRRKISGLSDLRRSLNKRLSYWNIGVNRRGRILRLRVSGDRRQPRPYRR